MNVLSQFFVGCYLGVIIYCESVGFIFIDYNVQLTLLDNGGNID